MSLKWTNFAPDGVGTYWSLQDWCPGSIPGGATKLRGTLGYKSGADVISSRELGPAYPVGMHPGAHLVS